MTLPEKQKQILISYNIEKADAAISDAQFLIDNSKVFAANNRTYYACFYILTALSLKDNFSTSKHKQLIGWFNKNYVHSNLVDKRYGEILINAYDQRTESDYGILAKPSIEDAADLLIDVKEFVAEIKKII